LWVKFTFAECHVAWYVVQYDGEDLCFGLVIDGVAELSYFWLSDVQAVQGKFDSRVMRDRFFKPCRLSEVLRKPA